MTQADARAVIEANAAFYRAFAKGDLAAMDALWARRATVACTHPGWSALIGREEVMASWAAILGSPERPAIAGVAPRALVMGEVAIVVCHEEVGGGWLAATNVFAREDGQWRLVHHHAGPAREGPLHSATGDRVH